MEPSVLLIPCRFDGCTRRYRWFWSVVRHLRDDHQIVQGYCCHFCGLHFDDIELIRDHFISVHGHSSQPRSAVNGLAGFFLREHRLENPAHCSVAVYKDRSENVDDPEERDGGLQEEESSDTRASPAVEEHESRQDEERSVVCPFCHQSIQIDSALCLLHHYRDHHCIQIIPTLADGASWYLNDSQSSGVLKRLRQVSLPTSFRSWVSLSRACRKQDSLVDETDIEHEEELEEELTAISDTTDIDSDHVSTDAEDETNATNVMSGQNGWAIAERHNVRGGHHSPVQNIYTNQMRDAEHSRVFKRLMNSIKETCRAEVESATTLYTTVHRASGKCRVPKHVAAERPIRENVIFATYGENRWTCSVNSCNATFSSLHLIDLHLYAHDNIHIWRCGESQWCRSKDFFLEKDTILSAEDESLEKHISRDHFDSRYARKALRRNPSRDVLATFLAQKLRLQTAPREIASNATGASVSVETRADTHHMQAEPSTQMPLSYDSSRSSKRSFEMYADSEGYCQEDRAKIRRLWIDYEGTVTDAVFDRHRNEDHVYMDKIRREHPTYGLLENHFWVETLVDLEMMSETYAKRYLAWYLKKSSFFGETNPSRIRSIYSWSIGLDYEYVRRKIPPRFDSAEDTSEHLSEEETAVPSASSKPRHAYKYARTRLICPWPDCTHTIEAFDTKYLMSIHLLVHHCDCVWQCLEPDCSHCSYSSWERLEAHRMQCHVGFPFQCGHHDCEMKKQGSLANNGYMSDRDLQHHFQWYYVRDQFGASKLQKQPSDAFGITSRQSFLGKEMEHLTTGHLVPSVNAITYFTKYRRERRKAENFAILSKYDVNIKQTTILGAQTCRGFWLNGRQYDCTDATSLDLQTAMLIFVPSLSCFTFAPTCEMCIFLMSAISRPLAELPDREMFSNNFSRSRRSRRSRIGFGSSIETHEEFLEAVKSHPLRLSLTAKKMRDVLINNPEKVFIVDFETVRPPKGSQNFPKIPLEVTFRNGYGAVVLSKIINRQDETNAEFELRMQQIFSLDHGSRASIRKVRGQPDSTVPKGVRTAKQIVNLIRKAGLAPNAFWIEYSLNFFDRHHMEALISDAEKNADDILPQMSNCWCVYKDLRMAVPGLASLKLGNVAQIFNPSHPGLNHLHRSNPDTAVLYDLLIRWFGMYGEGAAEIASQLLSRGLDVL